MHLLIDGSGLNPGLQFFGLVQFDGISTIIGYSMSNPFNTCILNIWFSNTLKKTFSNEPELIVTHSTKSSTLYYF